MTLNWSCDRKNRKNTFYCGRIQIDTLPTMTDLLQSLAFILHNVLSLLAREVVSPSESSRSTGHVFQKESQGM